MRLLPVSSPCKSGVTRTQTDHQVLWAWGGITGWRWGCQSRRKLKRQILERREPQCRKPLYLHINSSQILCSFLNCACLRDAKEPGRKSCSRISVAVHCSWGRVWSLKPAEFEELGKYLGILLKPQKCHISKDNVLKLRIHRRLRAKLNQTSTSTGWPDQDVPCMIKPSKCKNLDLSLRTHKNEFKISPRYERKS